MVSRTSVASPSAPLRKSTGLVATITRIAPVGPITRVEDCGVLETGHVRLKVNGEVRQDADISLMIWKIDEIIAKLSEQHELKAGDIIMTGTPAGVGAVVTGDVLDCSVDGLADMQVRVGAKAA